MHAVHAASLVSDTCLMNAPPNMQGRNVVLESKYGSPRIVNDGVTVAKEVELEDPVENIGAMLVRQVSRWPPLGEHWDILGSETFWEDMSNSLPATALEVMTQDGTQPLSPHLSQAPSQSALVQA